MTRSSNGLHNEKVYLTFLKFHSHERHLLALRNDAAGQNRNRWERSRTGWGRPFFRRSRQKRRAGPETRSNEAELANVKQTHYALFMVRYAMKAFFLVKILNPRTGRGGKFCPPLKFFEDITKTYGLILTSFPVPDQN